MDSLKVDPRFTADTVSVLRRLEANVRARTFELVRKHCWESGQDQVTGELITRCALEAMSAMVAEGRID